jgi:hypothetical protein
MAHQRGITLLAALLAVVAAAGCGGRSSDTSGVRLAAGAEPSKQFLVKGEESPIPLYGHEATVAEREAVSKVLEKSLRARAAGDWAAQCSTLSIYVMTQIEKQTAITKSTGKHCAKRLGQAAKSASASVLADTLPGSIDAMRTRGGRGFALYHGNDGNDYSMDMLKEENGNWKVNSLTTAKLPQG